MSTVSSQGPFDRYRPWFHAAAVYNLVWGAVNIAFPGLYFNLVNMDEPTYAAVWQVVGMFVLVYALAYWWAARDPYRHRHLIVIGLAGKVLGPVGYLWAVAANDLPASFGWTLITNDLIWWIPFSLFLRDAARLCGGWRALLRGD